MEINKNLIGTIILVILFSTIIGLFSFTFSQIKGGFEDPSIVRLFNIYLNISIWSLVGIIAIFFFELLINKGDSEYGDGIGFFSLGELPHIKLFENYSALQLTWISLIFFLLLGLGNNLLVSEFGFLQQSYTGVGFIEKQQFTSGESVLFSTLLVPASEELAIAFVIALTIFLLRFIARKYNIGEFNFVILCIFSVLIITFLTGLAWHIGVYPENDKVRIIGSSFWVIKGLLSVLTGLMLIGWMMHIVNNGMFAFTSLFSSDTALMVFSFVFFLLIIGYFLVYKNKSIKGVYS